MDAVRVEELPGGGEIAFRLDALHLGEQLADALAERPDVGQHVERSRIEIVTGAFVDMSRPRRRCLRGGILGQADAAAGEPEQAKAGRGHGETDGSTPKTVHAYLLAVIR